MSLIGKDVQDVRLLTDILKTYNSELRSIVAHHALLTAEHNMTILQWLSADVDTNLTDAYSAFCLTGGLEQVCIRIAMATMVLMFLSSAIVASEEMCNWNAPGSCAVDIAFSRLRRTEAFHTLMEQVLHARSEENELMMSYTYHVNMDIFDTMLATIDTQPMVDVKYLFITAESAMLVKPVCTLCDCKVEVPSFEESQKNNTPDRRGLLLLSCCHIVAHGCCICARLRKEQTACPHCLAEWSDETMARMIYARVHQLDVAMYQWGDGIKRRSMIVS